MNTINKINWLLACTALIISSCQTKEMSVEPDPIAQNEKFTFTAISGEEPQTKTLRKEDGAVWWSPDDEIIIFSGESSGRFVSQSTEASASASFTGSFDSPVSMESLSENGVMAFYPYSEDVTCDGESITFTLSASQNGVASTFDDDLFPCIAKSGNTDLHFYNICGGAKFTVSRDDIRTVTLKGNNGEYLAGKVKVSFDSDGVPFVEVLEGETEVTVSAPDGGAFKAGEEYYIITFPNDLKDGLTVVYNDASFALYDDDNNLLDKSFKVTNEVKVNRSKFGVLTDCDSKLSKVNMDSAIEFADAVMKEMCVNAFDTDGDGELSYNEAAAVTDLSKMTLTKKTFKSFDEFQYFTSINVIPKEYFKGIGLKSIVFPNSIRVIYANAFEKCKSLTSVHIINEVQSIGRYAFSECTSLEMVNIPDGITSIATGTFKGCIALKEINLHDNISSIGEEAFSGCKQIKMINLPQKLSKISGHTFEGCSGLQKINIDENVSEIGYKAFYGCSNLHEVHITSIESWCNISFFSANSNPLYLGASLYLDSKLIEDIDIPESITELGNYIFYGCQNIKSINIADSVTDIGESAFYGCHDLESVEMSNNISQLLNNTFYNCSSLLEITIPSSVLTVGRQTFKGCTSLEKINIYEGLEVVDYEAFAQCESLVSVCFPSTLQSYNSALSECANLVEVYFKSLVPPSLGYADNQFSNAKVYVPYNLIESYKSADRWSNFADSIIGYDFENDKVVE